MPLGTRDRLRHDGVVRYSIETPATHDRGPAYMEQVLRTLHAANPERLPISLSLERRGVRTMLLADVPTPLEAVFQSQLYAAYPDVKITPMEDAPSPSKQAVHLTLRLDGEAFACRCHGDFTSDPVSALLLSLQTTHKASPSITFTLWPASPKRTKRTADLFPRFHSSFLRRWHWLAARLWRWGVSENLIPRWTSRLLLRATRRRGSEPALPSKLHEPLLEITLTLNVDSTSASDSGTKQLEAMAGTFGLFAVPQRCRFIAERLTVGTTSRRPASFLLSIPEAATLWHPVTYDVRAPTVAAVTSRELEPPTHLHISRDEARLMLLGKTRFRGRKQKFGLLPEDKARHLYIVGKTGVGKSTLLHQLVLSDIERNAGVALLDPHGDLCDAVAQAIPSRRMNDVILFDPADADFPIALNLFDGRSAHERPLVASGILVAFRKIFGEFWGPRMEHLFRNALLTLLEVPGSSLLQVPRLFADARYRRRVTANLQDPVLRSFWENEYEAMHPKLQVEAASPIYNKVGAFLSSPLLRNILGQSQARLRMRPLMDRGQVLLVNLSKGKIGEDASTLLGSLLVTELQLAAMSRADQAERDRREFGVYIDEFQNFATASIATVHSEARKYRVTFTFAHQFLDQLDEGTAAAIFGNVGNLIAFQVGRDAEELAKHLGPPLTPEDLRFLPKYHAYAKLQIHGVPTTPFSMVTLSPNPRANPRTRIDVLRRLTRERYAPPRAKVESEIALAMQ